LLDAKHCWQYRFRSRYVSHFVRVPRLVFDKKFRPQQHQARVKRRQRLIEVGKNDTSTTTEQQQQQQQSTTTVSTTTTTTINGESSLLFGLRGAVSLASVTAGMRSSTGSARTDGMSLVLAARKRKGRRRLHAHRGAVGDNAAPIGKEGNASRSGRAVGKRATPDAALALKPSGRDQPMVVRYRRMKEKMHRIQVQRSPIHEWGAFLTESVGPGELLLEYVGELIRYSLCDKREKEYERQGIGT
jgi:hypothetical protein